MSDKPLTASPHPAEKCSEGRENGAVARAEHLPHIHHGAVTGFWVDNTVFIGCRLQILGKDPFFL